MASDERCLRRPKSCCGVSALFLVVLLGVLLVLYLTVFKPKRPEIAITPVRVEGFDFQPSPLKLKATLGILIAIKNRNIESYNYQNTTIYVKYHGTVLAEGPIKQDTVPSRGTHYIRTSLHIIADKLLDSKFVPDFLAGSLNLTSSTTMHGEVTVFKILKVPATVYCRCKISLFFGSSLNVVSKCSSAFKN